MVTPYFILIVFGLLPSLFWLVFFLFEDRKNPEPKQMITQVFLAGGVAALAAAALELFLHRATPFVIAPYGCATEVYCSFYTLLALGFVEEIVKFAAAYLVINKNAAFDEPIDAMIYMVTAGLGFAALENILFLSSITVDTVLETAILRFIGATLLHAVASGFIGFYWMRGRLVVGLVIATTLHAIFNYFVLEFQSVPLYATLILIIASFFLFYDFDIIKRYVRK